MPTGAAEIIEKPSGIGFWTDIDVYGRQILLSSGMNDESSNTSSNYNLWIYSDGELIVKEDAHKDHISAVSWLTDSSFASASFDRTIKIWKVGENGIELTRNISSSKVLSMTKVGSNLLAYTTSGCEFIIQDISTEEIHYRINGLYFGWDPAWDGMNRIAFSNGSSLMIYNTQSNVIEKHLNYSNSVLDLEWNNEGDELAIAFNNYFNEKQPKIYNIETNSTEPLGIDYLHARSIQWSPDGRYITTHEIINELTSELTLWNSSNLEKLASNSSRDTSRWVTEENNSSMDLLLLDYDGGFGFYSIEEAFYELKETAEPVPLNIYPGLFAIAIIGYLVRKRKK